MINELSQRLLALHAGGIEKDFTPWVTDAVLARVLREGVVLRPDPRNVLYQIGAPLQCHANALNFELMGVKLVRGVVPWFGFRLMDRCWWCHSFVVSGGLVIDSGAPSLSSLYFAIPWDAGLFRMLWPDEEVPAILTKDGPHENATTSGVRCAVDTDHALATGAGPC